MKLTRDHKIKQPAGDKVFKAIVFFFTVIWILVLLFPVYWLLISTVKDQIAIFKTPPDFIPQVPNDYVVQIRYTPEQWSGSKDIYNVAAGGRQSEQRREIASGDAAVAAWTIFENFKDIQVGRVTVRAVVGDKVMSEAILELNNYKLKRDVIWASNLVTDREIVEKQTEAWMYMSNRIMGNDSVRVFDKNDATKSITSLLGETRSFKGTVFDVSMRKSYESLLSNYKAAWKFPERYSIFLGFEMYMKNSFVIAFLSILFQWIVSGMAAYALSRMMKKRASFIFTMFFLATLTVPGAVTMIPLYLLVENLRLMDTIWAIVLPGIPGAFSIYLMKGFFDGLPNDIFESARIDGANEFKILRKIALPMSYPIFGVIAMFVFLASWNDFFWPFLVLKSEQNLTFSLVINRLTTMNSAGARIDYPLALSMSVISSIPTLFVFAVFQKQLEKGLVWGGIKG